MTSTTPGTRRAVLALGAAGVAGAVAGCEVYGRPEAPPPPPPPDGTGDGGDDGDGGTPVASTGDVPVGGGLILADQSLVVTQPTAGEFKGFSALCTHQGCTVDEVRDGLIICPCHDSQFSIEDGSVVQQARTLPADAVQDPLPEAGILVDGDTIALP